MEGLLSLLNSLNLNLWRVQVRGDPKLVDLFFSARPTTVSDQPTLLIAILAAKRHQVIAK